MCKAIGEDGVEISVGFERQSPAKAIDQRIPCAR
jgi:hypothetical protein